MTVLYVALAGFLSWLINTVAGGGGEFIFISAVTYLVRAQAVAPVVTLGNLLGVPSRVLLFASTSTGASYAGSWPAQSREALRAPGSSRAKAEWLQLLIALFLLSAPLQYRFGEREKSFEVRLWWFLPAGLLVAFFSGLIGGTGPVLNPLYLNYGTVKEEMIGTKSFNSFVMHLTKFGTYTAFGALKWEYLWYGVSVGVVAIFANWLGKRWLERISVERFRRLVIWLMVASGVFMIW